ncbi:hypothetical protein Sjap_022884 [Stephania japonica]|uniref:Reverse transcriptase Ty1/copia-type domain-containing protein n=1 Tax=Stephania japonica TaxID=461633 RepID=A0AAP0ESS0_9MAGN
MFLLPLRDPHPLLRLSFLFLQTLESSVPINSIYAPVESSISTFPYHYSRRPHVHVGDQHFSTDIQPLPPSATTNEAPGDDPSTSLPQPPPVPRYDLRDHSTINPPARFGLVAHDVHKPDTYREVMEVPEWQLAMTKELAALERTGTWEVVPLPEHVPITYKLVVKVKTRSNGSIERYKARLVAQGFQQEHGRDYDETFAPVAHMTTVRTFIVMAAVRQWTISQLDVKNAFLHRDLHEEVHMKPPPGFSCPTGHVFRLCRALYVLKQAPPAWFERFNLVILQAGFVASEHDPAMFVHTSSRGRTILLLYVDDMIITGDDPSYIDFNEQLMMYDLGPLRYFLGIEVTSTDDGFYLSQQRYTLDLLSRSGITDAKTVTTPMELHLQLRPNGSTPLSDPSRYRQLVGSLIYLAVTRPDISHVHVLSQFVSAPTYVHYAHLLRVLRYLRGTSSIDDLSLVIVSFLVLIFLHGSPRNKLLFLVLVLRPSYVLSHLRLLRLSGFVGFFFIWYCDV